MKIAYISNSRFPSERAHAVQIVLMCNAFAKLGHAVTLFVTNRSTHIKETPEDFYGTPIRFSIERIWVLDIVGSILKIPQFTWPFIYTLQRIVFVVNVWRSIRSRNFEYMYGRDEWVLVLISFLTNIPVVWESHEAKYSFMARMLLKRCNKVVVISEGIRDFYIQKKVAAKKILVAHDAIDETFFETPIDTQFARAELGITKEKPVVLYIGGLDKWKGVETLFEAAKSHTDEFKVYVIGGQSRELPTFKNQYPWVTFLGPRPYKELKNHQQAADILVVPNTAHNDLSAKYTSPLKLFAHMASNIPLVISDLPSMKNVLSDEHAFFFTPDCPQALVNSIRSVLDNPALAKQKSSAAYELSKRFTWNQRANAIVSFIG